MTLHGAIILGVWVAAWPFAFRALARAFLHEFTYDDELDGIDAAFSLLIAAAFAAIGAPAIVAFRAAQRIYTGDDVAAFARRIAGESREARRARLEREIEQLDRELGLS